MGHSRLTWADFKRCFTSIFRGSLIGVVMGAIPGIGGAPAAYLSYSEARRYSKRAANFGKGELEGIAAAEAGNNGVCGATLIPLLSLGVPGDIVTAVMLGAFMMHNITPGPLLFEENLPLVYALYFGIILSSLFLLISGFFCLRGADKITRAPRDGPVSGHPLHLPVRRVLHQQQRLRHPGTALHGPGEHVHGQKPHRGSALSGGLHPRPAL